MKTEGLYISLLPDGTMQRHLSTKHGEVPLPNTTIPAELIQLSEKDHIHLYQAIKDIWAHSCVVTSDPEAFMTAVDDVLRTLQSQDITRHTLLLTLLQDSWQPKPLLPFDPTTEALFIANSLSQSMAADLEVYRVLDALSNGQPMDLEEDHSMLRQAKAAVIFTFGEKYTTEYLFRSEEQYYIFLLQQFLLTRTTVSTCQYCGRFFIPKTRKKTIYCDRIIRDGKTCKQIAPYLKHRERVAANKVTSEFHRAKDLLLHRLDRSGYGKKPSAIDLTYKEFYRWLDAATAARDRFLAGEITEAEAIRIIHVPTIHELQQFPY